MAAISAVMVAGPGCSGVAGGGQVMACAPAANIRVIDRQMTRRRNMAPPSFCHEDGTAHRRVNAITKISSETSTAMEASGMKPTFVAALLVPCFAFSRAAGTATSSITVPDVRLVDQDGKSVRVPDLLRGKTAVVNFIFTSCTTICSPMGANFAALQSRLGNRGDVALVSVSIDPAMDTPARLKKWSARFNAKPGWTLLTGEKREVDTLLKAFGVYTPDRISHSPVVMIGNQDAGRWTRANGLTPPADLLPLIEAARGVPNHARNYFGEVQLVNQDGETMRLYSDLLSGKTVIINTFFASCDGACPVLAGKLAEIQERLGDRLGNDVSLISISLDPEADTPAKLKAYAKRVHARRGWYFMTGTKQNVDQVLRKFGQYVDDKSVHLNVLLIG